MISSFVFLLALPHFFLLLFAGSFATILYPIGYQIPDANADERVTEVQGPFQAADDIEAKDGGLCSTR